MTFQALIINDPPGSFRVKNSSGDDVFDSRFATQRIHMVGNASLVGPSTAVSATTLLVPYGKTFAKIPYVRSASRITAFTTSPNPYGDNYYPPLLSWTKIVSTGAQFFSGNYTAAQLSGLYLGNAHQNPGGTTARFVYAVFDNPVEY